MPDITSQIVGRNVDTVLPGDAGYEDRENQRNWDKTLRTDPIGRLLLADAMLARYESIRDQGSVHVIELKANLKGKVAEILRTVDPALVLGNFHAKRLVLKLFSDAGLKRLEDRAGGTV